MLIEASIANLNQKKYGDLNEICEIYNWFVINKIINFIEQKDEQKLRKKLKLVCRIICQHNQKCPNFFFLIYASKNCFYNKVNIHDKGVVV